LSAGQVQPGTHITAVGADTPEKQELDPYILKMADIVVADSISQCVERGDIAHAVRAGIITAHSLVELGHVISGAAAGRSSESQITVADLTGVAVQDIQIAKAVYQAIN
jgi:ornithine cyclodeaminase